MWFDSSLAGWSIWITFCLQVIFGYLATLCICAFIQNPRIRVRMWGCFLFLTVLTWLLLWVPARAGGPVHFAVRSASLPSASDLHVALPVKSGWTSYFARLASAAGRVYVFLLLISLLHLLFKSVQLRAFLRHAQQPSPQLQLLFGQLCSALGITLSELVLVSELRSPATCYWRRSHVLLPAELVPQLDDDELASVLRHELIHVRRHDYLWDRLSALGCRLLFFHPLVWSAYRRLRWERELACDCAVVEQCAEARLPYAECLTRLARWFVEASRVSEGIGFSSSSESLLTVRVRALLSEPSSSSNFQKGARVTLVASVAVTALSLIPGFGLSLYSPVAGVFVPSSENHIDSAGRKAPKRRAQHSSLAKAMAAEPRWKLPQSEPLRTVNMFLESQSTSLPVLLGSSTAAPAALENPSTRSDKNDDDSGLHSSRPAWDEAPTALASPPQWRKLVVGAITDGVAVASGRIDVDDIDVPHKRSR